MITARNIARGMKGEHQHNVIVILLRYNIMHVTYLQFINANCNKQTDSEAGEIEDPLGQHKPHREEDIGGREEREDEEGEGKERQLFPSRFVFGVIPLGVSILELYTFSLFSTVLGR